MAVVPGDGRDCIVFSGAGAVALVLLRAPSFPRPLRPLTLPPLRGKQSALGSGGRAIRCSHRALPCVPACWSASNNRAVPIGWPRRALSFLRVRVFCWSGFRSLLWPRAHKPVVAPVSAAVTLPTWPHPEATIWLGPLSSFSSLLIALLRFWLPLSLRSLLSHPSLRSVALPRPQPSASLLVSSPLVVSQPQHCTTPSGLFPASSAGCTQPHCWRTKTNWQPSFSAPQSRSAGCLHPLLFYAPSSSSPKHTLLLVSAPRLCPSYVAVCKLVPTDLHTCHTRPLIRLYAVATSGCLWVHPCCCAAGADFAF